MLMLYRRLKEAQASIEGTPYNLIGQTLDTETWRSSAQVLMCLEAYRTQYPSVLPDDLPAFVAAGLEALTLAGFVASRKLTSVHDLAELLGGFDPGARILVASDEDGEEVVEIASVEVSLLANGDTAVVIYPFR